MGEKRKLVVSNLRKVIKCIFRHNNQLPKSRVEATERNDALMDTIADLKGIVRDNHQLGEDLSQLKSRVFKAAKQNESRCDVSNTIDDLRGIFRDNYELGKDLNQLRYRVECQNPRQDDDPLSDARSILGDLKDILCDNFSLSQELQQLYSRVEACN